MALNRRPTVHLLCFIILPFLLCSVIVVIIVGIEPGKAGNGADRAGITWLAYTSRFLSISGVCLSVSLLLGSLSPDGVCRWLHRLGVPKKHAFQIASPLILIQALKRKLLIIIDARYASGFVDRRGVISNARQLFPVLQLIISAGLTMAIERADIWQQDDIMGLIEADTEEVVGGTSLWPNSIFAWLISGLVMWLNLTNVNFIDGF